MAVTINDIARQYGTTPSTVSRALRDAPTISFDTRQQIKALARDLGYRPSATARALATGRTKRIAFWSPGVGSRFYQELGYRFHQILRKESYELLAGEFGPHMMDPANSVGFTRMDVDGVLVHGGGLGMLKPVLEDNFPAKAPIVNMGSVYEGTLDFVQVDLYPAAREAVRYLLDLGRSRIAHMATTFTQENQYARYRAYHEVLGEAGMKPEYITVDEGLLAPSGPRSEEYMEILEEAGKDDYIAPADAMRASSRVKIKEYIKEHGCPDAITCGNDEIAIGAYRGLLDLGIHVPDDVVLVGCDGITDLKYLDAPICTIKQPMDEMCTLAWQFLSRRIQNPDMPLQRASLKARFILRP